MRGRASVILWGIVAAEVVLAVTVFAITRGGGDEAQQAVAPPAPGGAAVVAEIPTPADLLAMGLGTLPPVTMPPDNRLNDAKIELGLYLYFDPRMSGNGEVSCASCHIPDLGWGDGGDLSLGYTNTLHWRNSQTIINAVYLQKLFWGGSSLSLEAQAKSAWTGNAAGNLDTSMAEERMRQIPLYVRLFEEAFGTEAPSFDDALRAVAAFESTITSRNVPFDRYLEGDADALSPEALQGLSLFVSRAGCIQCHSGPLLTDESFHALGVPNNPQFETDPQRQIMLRYKTSANGVPEEVYRSIDRDLGLYFQTKQEADKGRFRTPPLREVGQTWPYMHNGVFFELDEVVRFYNEGGGDDPNKSPLLEPLGLTDQEVAALVAFLESLTGDEIIVEAPEMPPYTVMP